MNEQKVLQARITFNNPINAHYFGDVLDDINSKYCHRDKETGLFGENIKLVPNPKGITIEIWE